MPKNLTEILDDDGEFKICKEFIMVGKNKKWELDQLHWRLMNSDVASRKETITTEDFEEIEVIKDNPDYVSPTRRYVAWKNKFFDDGNLIMDNYGCYEDERYSVCRKFGNTEEIQDYLGIIPFKPCAMLNICPDWKESKLSDDKKISILKFIIDFYFRDNGCNRFIDYTYTIECGSKGDNIHAHVVATINPLILKSVRTHLGHGNAREGMKKAIEKMSGPPLKGREGWLKGRKGAFKGSVQYVPLETEEIVRDKLDYLVEEKKPDGHKNLERDGFPIWFTSKE